MPSNQSPLGALPARFRRERVLIVGCGDVGLRVARALAGRVRLLALTSSPGRVALLRSLGITPLQGDLDRASTLARVAGLATRVVHLAPPSSEDHSQWWRDLRTLALLRALRRRLPPASLVYGSTSGVYGDCAGEWVDETRPLNPRTPPGPTPGGRGAGRSTLRARGPCAGRHPAHPRHLCPGPRRRHAARAPAQAHARAGRERRRLHQPHPCRRPGARGGGRPVAKQAATRLQRQRRHRAEDGRLLRPGGRPLRPGPTATGAPRHCAGRIAADAAQFHERIAAAATTKAQAGAAAALRYPTVESGLR